MVWHGEWSVLPQCRVDFRGLDQSKGRTLRSLAPPSSPQLAGVLLYCSRVFRLFCALMACHELVRNRSTSSWLDVERSLQSSCDKALLVLDTDKGENQLING